MRDRDRMEFFPSGSQPLGVVIRPTNITQVIGHFAPVEHYNHDTGRDTFDTWKRDAEFGKR
jgi:hypothetical protein